MPDRLDTLLADIRAKKTCDLKIGSLVTDEFLSIPPHRVGIFHLAMKPRFLLGDPTGCGKTPQALVAYAYLKQKDPKLRMIVVTIRGSLFQWQTSIKQFLKQVKGSVAGYSKRRAKESPESRRWQWQLDESDIMVTTYHTLARDINAILPHYENFILVLDEIQTIGSTEQTFLFPAAQKLSCKARYVWGLSATPFMTRLENLFAVFEAIKPGLLGGSLMNFRKAYIIETFVPKLRRSIITGYRDLDKLAALIAPYILKRPAEEINAHLPSIVPKPIMIDMGTKQRELFDRIKALVLPAATGESVVGNKKLLARDDSTKSPANETLTLDKLQEVIEGESAFREKRAISKWASYTYMQFAVDAPELLGFPDIPSAKWTELHRFLVDECANGEKVIIYSKFEKVVTWLAAQLKDAGITHARITGKESAKVIERDRVAFQTQPDPRVMLIDDAGGQALDLQAAGIVVFYDLPWGWGAFKQILGRARRIGSKHSKVLAVALLTTDSIDTSNLQLLNRAEKIVDQTLSLADSDKAISPIATAAKAATVVDATDADALFSLLQKKKRGSTEESTEISFDELFSVPDFTSTGGKR